MGHLGTQVGQNDSVILYPNGRAFVRLHLRMYDRVMGKSMASKKKISSLIHTYLVPPCQDNT